PPADEDGDGVPATVDCDDGDPTLGMSGTRPCAAPGCAAENGVQTCTMGRWGACDAPSCECSVDEEGTTREVACGNCGTQLQRCTGGAWVNDGACTGSGECS